jgi:hypothetical protein
MALEYPFGRTIPAERGSLMPGLRLTRHRESCRRLFSSGPGTARDAVPGEAQRSSARVSGVASAGSGAQRLRRLVVRVVDKIERG